MATDQGHVPEHFIVVVPGIMGSTLRDRTTGRTVWVDFGSIPLNPLAWDDWLDSLFATLAYPNEDLDPVGLMDEVVFVPPWAKQEHYGRLVEALEQMGYRLDPARHPESELNAYAFAYDWRQDNRLSARQLGEVIERWRQLHPGAQAWIVAHSMGGLVARWYIEQLGGKDRVGRLLLLGSPWDGAPKAMRVLFGGLETLFRGYFNAVFDIPERTRDLVRGFPATYQLLPHTDPFLRGLNNEPVDLFATPTWLGTDVHRGYLADGRRFNQELGTATSVETLCFFGRRKSTTSSGLVHLEAADRWKGIEWDATSVGDGTVPEGSAVHPNAHAQLPFAAGHGDIYVNPAVLEFLRWELVDKYRGVRRAVVTTARLTVVFEPDRDLYRPGEAIALRATIHRAADGAPVARATVTAQLRWHAPLPGGPREAPTGEPPAARLRERKTTAGRYEASIVAPQTEGYYQILASVRPVGGRTIQLEELVAIEAVPPPVIAEADGS